MIRPFRATLWGLLLVATLASAGCFLRETDKWSFTDDVDHYHTASTEIEYPNLDEELYSGAHATPAPVTIRNLENIEYWDLTLEDAIKITLDNSKVLKDLGGAVIQSPTASRTIYGPAIQETDPRFGVQAALSAFDAVFSTRVDYDKTDRAFNSEVQGGGTRLFQRDLLLLQADIAKRTAQGTELTIRKNTDYDANNSPANLFPSAWNTSLEGEIRQPWLQGAGLKFNRIVGPTVNGRSRSVDGTPGDYNGVLIARVNTDIRLADFEMGVRDLVSNVENTYWDLYFAYRDLNAKITARDGALETWRRIHALYEAGRVGGEAEKEAQSREQYYRFEQEVQNALSGRLLDGTRTNNGSRGGTFRATGGVHVVERRLRLLMGVPSSDGKLIRPANEPVMAEVVFDWDEIATECLSRRTELRRQKWEVKRRELEYIASQNFLLPRLDTVGRYRFRGFGHELIDSSRDGRPRFDNAYMDLTSGKFQEWGLGMELSFPLGFRKEHAAVRNAELRLARERAVLDEQERQVIHDLSNAVGDMDRAYAVAQSSYNRRVSAQQQLEAVTASYDADKATLDQLLDAQRRLAEGSVQYYRMLAEYALAIKNVHFEKGSLLDFSGVYLSEGPWPGKAYHDAERLEARRGRERPINYCLTDFVSAGPAGSVTHFEEEEVPAVPYEAEPPSGPTMEFEALPPGEPEVDDPQPLESVPQDETAENQLMQPQVQLSFFQEGPPLPGQSAEQVSQPGQQQTVRGPADSGVMAVGATMPENARDEALSPEEVEPETTRATASENTIPVREELDPSELSANPLRGSSSLAHSVETQSRAPETAERKVSAENLQAGKELSLTATVERNEQETLRLHKPARVEPLEFEPIEPVQVPVKTEPTQYQEIQEIQYQQEIGRKQRVLTPRALPASAKEMRKATPESRMQKDHLPVAKPIYRGQHDVKADKEARQDVFTKPLGLKR